MKRSDLTALRPRLVDVLAALGLMVMLVLLANAAQGEERSPYGYLRSVEGSATLLAAEEGESWEASVNQPVLPGDRVVVDGGRLEVVLPEGTRVRLGAGTVLSFASLGAYDDDGPRLQVEGGTMQLTVPDAAAGLSTPRIDTGNASLYIVEPGRFAIDVRGTSYTQVTVREGAIEVLTPRGSTVVRAQQALSVQGAGWPEVAHVQPSAWSDLESWGEELDTRLAYTEVPAELGDDLAYQAAPLQDHGNWVEVEGNTAWRPHVASDWRPYTEGRWHYTPRGLNWVSYEPWGWVPYHYGYWDYVSFHGWVWFPARTWAPAWVYWHWGPSYVGWSPVGIYVRHYSPRYSHFGLGFRLGHYGYASGHWGHYRHWNFVPAHRLRSRHLGPEVRRVRASVTRPDRARTAVPRGLVTTDTSGLTREAWQRPERAHEVLATRAAATRPGGSRELADVTSFVSRADRLDSGVERAVLSRPGGGERVMAPVNRGVATRTPAGQSDRAAAAPRGDARAVARPTAGTADAIRGGRQPVTRTEPSPGASDSWRRSPVTRPTDPSAGAGVGPERPGVRTPESGSRAPAVLPRSSQGSDTRVGGSPVGRPAPAGEPGDSRREVGARPLPEADGAQWRGRSMTRTDPQRPEGSQSSRPVVRRVIDSVRAPSSSPPASRGAAPSSRPSASPSEGSSRAPAATPPPSSGREGVRGAPSSRPSSGPPPSASSRPSRPEPSASRGSSSQAARGTPSSRPSSGPPPSASSRPSRSEPSASRGSSSAAARGAPSPSRSRSDGRSSSVSSRSSGKSQAAPSRGSSSRGGSESRGRASSSRRSPR